jgi:hypothetical protein
MINPLRKPGIEGMYLNVIKATYDKYIGSFILNGDKLKTFSLISGMRQGCLLSHSLWNS